MDNRTRASKPAMQLGELLQEQQEPFILEVYLSERGYGKRSLTSEDNFTSCHGDSCKFLKKSRSLNKSKQGRLQFPKVLKVILCNEFFTFKRLRTKNSDDEARKISVIETDINNQETAESDRFSSASSATMYNSCTDSDIDDESPMFADSSMSDLEKKVVEDTKFEWNCMEENKHSSPRSVLEEISTSTSSPLHNSRQVSSKRLFWSKLIKVDSMLSTWLLNLLVQTRPQKSSCGAGLKDVTHWSSSSKSSKSKRVLQQTKQRIREWIESNYDKEERGKSLKGSQNMKGWRKRCADKSNIKQLLVLDMINTSQEWKNEFESQKRCIGLGIGNDLVEESISEVIMDMINVLYRRCNDFCVVSITVHVVSLLFH